jgi:hypothetical protein
MALNKTIISKEIGDLVTETEKLELEEAKKRFNNGLAEIIIKAIQSADITIISGLIQVQGSPTAQANVAPIKITKGIS